MDALDVWATLPRFLGVVDAATVDVDAYLSLAKDHGKPRHALALRKFVASTRLRDLADARHLATPRLQRDSAEALARALACYVGDPGDARVFAYASRTLRRFRERSGLARLPPALVQCVLDCLPKLADLDGERTAALCCDLCASQIFNPTSMCAYSNVLTRSLPPCFENSLRAIDSSKNQPNRLRFDRAREF